MNVACIRCFKICHVSLCFSDTWVAEPACSLLPLFHFITYFFQVTYKGKGFNSRVFHILALMLNNLTLIGWSATVFWWNRNDWVKEEYTSPLCWDCFQEENRGCGSGEMGWCGGTCGSQACPAKAGVPEIHKLLLWVLVLGSLSAQNLASRKYSPNASGRKVF